MVFPFHWKSTVPSLSKEHGESCPYKSIRLRVSGAAEGGGTGDAGVGAVVGEEHGNFGEALIDAPVGELLSDAGEEAAHELRKPAAKNKNVGFEEIDDVARPNCEEVGGFLKDLRGERIALLKSFGDDFGVDGVCIATREREDFRAGLAGFRKPFARTARDGCAGRQGFDAAAFAAAANRAVIVDGYVAAFGGAACAAVIDVALEDNSGSDTGA